MEKKQKMSELYKLPAGWEWIKLESAGRVFSGSSAPQEEKYFINGIYPFVRTRDLATFGTTANFTSFNDYINDECINNKSLVLAKKGTIVFPKSGASIGTNNRAMLGSDSYIVSHLGAFYSNCEITNIIIYNYFLTIDLLDFCENPSYPSLKISRVKDIQIPLPPLTEQKRIVAKLDSLFEKIDKAIELHQQNITNANTLMASTLDKTFKKLEGEYSNVALLDIMKISNKTVIPDDNQKYNYVGLENIEGNTGRLVDFCETEGKEIKSSKIEFKKGMVLYGKLRPYLNKVWFSEFDGVATTEILPFYSIDETILNMVFVKYYFLSSSYLQRVMRNCNGSRMPRLTTAFLKSEEAYIPLPLLPIQQQTVEYLDNIATKVDKIKQLNEQKLENLKALKASILDKAFRGEL